MFLLKSPILRGAPEFELATNTLVNAPKGYGWFVFLDSSCMHIHMYYVLIFYVLYVHILYVIYYI